MFFRLLHIACGLMIVLLGAKVYDLVEYAGSPVLAPAAMAQTPGQAAPVEKPPAPAGEAVLDACQGGGCQKESGAVPVRPSVVVDPDLKKALAAREKELNQKAEALDGRQRLVDAAEEELQRRMTSLETARSQLEVHERRADDLVTQDADRLVRIYEAMKPVDAAAIFNILDLRVGVGLLNRMNPRKASAIMAVMSPQRAILATQLLANGHAHPVSAGGHG